MQRTVLVLLRKEQAEICSPFERILRRLRREQLGGVHLVRRHLNPLSLFLPQPCGPLQGDFLEMSVRLIQPLAGVDKVEEELGMKLFLMLHPPNSRLFQTSNIGKSNYLLA
jgi:hypothetical protein